MDRKAQRDKSSTACETAHTKEKVDAKKKREHAKWLEESSRSEEQHAEKSDWIAYSVKEC